HTKPRIWRVFSVPGNIRLDRLHDAMQAVMGWTNSHLHAFRIGTNEYGQAAPSDTDWQQAMSDMITRDESKFTLRDLITAEGDKFHYNYDFGDNWEHEIKVKEILPTAKRLKSAHCHGGKRACPPEDCGGPFGHEELCKALPNPKHPEHDHWKGWIGDYDPAQFDRDDVNLRLSVVRV
ncbi:MAG: plasmid pRiA4b ORF-3 family protein, partial [Lacunisphaera sp.]